MCQKEGSERSQFLKLLLTTIERVVSGSINSRALNPTLLRLETAKQLMSVWSVWCVSCDNSIGCCITALANDRYTHIRIKSESIETGEDGFGDYDS